MHIRLLGGFAVEVDGVVVEPRRWRLRHARTLVAMLALAHGQRLTRDAVIDELWPEVDQAAGSHNLHQAMYVARRAVAVEDQADDVELLSVHDGQVVLAPGGDIAVDALEFEAAALEALATDSTPALESAAARYAGPLLPELPDARWAETRRAALARMFHDVLVRLGEHRVAEGDPGGGRVAFERVLADDPLNEPAVRGLMGALADEGRRSEALTRYERLGRDLLTAYATDPDRLTKELYRALLVADTPDERRAPLRSLPVPLTTMIGREREVAELERVLRRSRMTTLTGPGGAGKTRLALELAARIHRDFEHGATFVDLSALSEERFVPSVVGTALGLLQGERADPADVVTEQLGRQRVLIVLDNCEHLLRGCARLASAVLSRCPNVVLLATSREPLRVAGEAVYRVPSLELPAAHVGGADDVEQVASVASVRLFTERAVAAGSGFLLGRGNCASVAALCRRLDGIPLALELAAARTTLLAPDEIVARLDDALDVLGPGAGSVTRHETLRGTLVWSHELLTDDERVLFRRLSVFAGTFALAAAEDVCGADPLERRGIVELLGRLVDRSLVIAEASPVGTRYRLLETVRQFAHELLNASGESGSVAAEHCAHYLRVAQVQDPAQASAPLLEQPSVLDRDDDNFRAALRWSLRAEPTSALALASSLWRFWFLRCDVAEGAEWIERALQAAPERSAQRAQALIGLTGLDARRGRSDRIRHQAAAAVEIAVALGDRATALQHGIVHAVLVWATSEVTEAQDVAAPLEREALALGRPDLHAATTWVRAHFALTREVEGESRALLSRCLAELETVSADAPPFLPVVTPCIALVPVANRVVPTYEESLIVGRRVGARQGVAYALSAQGYAFRLGDDLGSAQDVVEQAVQRFATLGDDAGRAQALNQLGCVLRDAGRYDEADLRLAEAWELRRRFGDRRGEWQTSGSRALLAALRGDEDEGRAGAMRALVAFEAVGDRPSVANARAGLGTIELAAGRVDRARGHYARATEEFAVQSWPRIEGWHRVVLAELSLELGDLRRAEAEVTRALVLFRRQQCSLGIERARSVQDRLVAGTPTRSKAATSRPGQGV